MVRRDTAELNEKSLNTKLKEISKLISEKLVESKTEESRLKSLQCDIKSLREEEKKLKKELSDLAEKDIVVTEHAILRYLEYVEGLNIEEIKEKILNPTVKSYIKKFPSGKFPNEELGLKLVVKNRVITTVHAK